MTRLLIPVALIAVLLVAGCSSNQKSEQASAQAASNVELNGQAVTLAGITFRPPSDWKDLGPSGMRKADYTYGPVDGDTDSATVSVFYFGPNSGGGVMDNIERWIGQMSLPNGEDPHKSAVQNSFTVDGMTVHMVELDGTFNASMGGPMSGSVEAMPDYKMAAAVLEGPEGNVFFKLTGPKKTADQMITGFDAMLHAIKKGSQS
jgi:hypothetical protein